MKWVTREKARVDRIACPWLISRFIDKQPTFLFVPKDQVMSVAEREGAIPVRHSALRALALIVRGADTEARQLTPESAGLYALATGFQAMAKDDRDNMVKQFPAYDALYAYCRSMADRGPR